MLAFGHAVLAMSGEETASPRFIVKSNRPRCGNFKRAAFIVFVYSLVLTAGVSFLAVLIIPDEVRMKYYSGNLIFRALPSCHRRAVAQAGARDLCRWSSAS